MSLVSVERYGYVLGSSFPRYGPLVATRCPMHSRSCRMVYLRANVYLRYLDVYVRAYRSQAGVRAAASSGFNTRIVFRGVRTRETYMLGNRCQAPHNAWFDIPATQTMCSTRRRTCVAPNPTTCHTPRMAFSRRKLREVGK